VLNIKITIFAYSYG